MGSEFSRWFQRPKANYKAPMLAGIVIGAVEGAKKKLTGRGLFPPGGGGSYLRGGRCWAGRNSSAESESKNGCAGISGSGPW